MAATVVTLKPFSREWWAAWHADIASGRPVVFLGAQARRGVGRSVRAGERPCGTASAILVPVPVDGRAFAAWAAHYDQLGIRLPKPSKAPVIWMPATMPSEGAA